MFDKQYRFTGTHAKMVEDLTNVFDEQSNAKLFERNIDVYINAPLVGFLYQRKAKKNSDGNYANQNIFPEQMIGASEKLKYNLRLILLLDSYHEPDKDKRLDKAFRNLGQEDDLALFDEYVLGGVEIFHEKLIEGASSPNDYVNHLYDFLEDFQERFNAGITSESILYLCNTEK